MTRIKAVLFDQDGVIIDTERDGHRVAFNTAFREFGFSVDWDVATYGGLLRIGGGKERMRHQLHEKGFGKEVCPEEEDALIKALHKRKTDIFIELIESGKLPLRPGVHRMMREVMAQGLVLGICTTSAERAARAIVGHALGDIRFDFVLAGDVVEHKKPAPDIYLLAMERSGVGPEQCLVFEDSRNGVEAAKSAGMNVVATVNDYTRNEDLSGADIIVTCLGDPEGEKAELLSSRNPWTTGGVVHLTDLIGYFG